jgi:uracil-DNA glycosylase
LCLSRQIWRKIRMNPSAIPTLLKQLASVSASTTVANPYSSPACLINISIYLNALCALPFSGHLLLGEAPGHKGCALTGIPFTSQRVLTSSAHPFIATLRPSLAGIGSATESTATIVWGHLLSCAVVPAFWNAFPFHPHKPTTTNSNRSPTSSEVASGHQFLGACASYFMLAYSGCSW